MKCIFQLMLNVFEGVSGSFPLGDGSHPANCYSGVSASQSIQCKDSVTVTLIIITVRAFPLPREEQRKWEPFRQMLTCSLEIGKFLGKARTGLHPCLSFPLMFSTPILEGNSKCQNQSINSLWADFCLTGMNYPRKSKAAF